MAPRRDPAVLPIGRKGTAGKTAKTQKIANAIKPNTTFETGANAIIATKQANNNFLVPTKVRYFLPPLYYQQYNTTTL